MFQSWLTVPTPSAWSSGPESSRCPARRSSCRSGTRPARRGRSWTLLHATKKHIPSFIISVALLQSPQFSNNNQHKWYNLQVPSGDKELLQGGGRGLAGVRCDQEVSWAASRWAAGGFNISCQVHLQPPELVADRRSEPDQPQHCDLPHREQEWSRGTEGRHLRGGQAVRWRERADVRGGQVSWQCYERVSQCYLLCFQCKDGRERGGCISRDCEENLPKYPGREPGPERGGERGPAQAVAERRRQERHQHRPRWGPDIDIMSLYSHVVCLRRWPG